MFSGEAGFPDIQQSSSFGFIHVCCRFSPNFQSPTDPCQADASGSNFHPQLHSAEGGLLSREPEPTRALLPQITGFSSAFQSHAAAAKRKREGERSGSGGVNVSRVRTKERGTGSQSEAAFLFPPRAHQAGYKPLGKGGGGGETER